MNPELEARFSREEVAPTERKLFYPCSWEESVRLAHVALTKYELQEWILNLLSGVEVVPTRLEEAKQLWRAEERK